MKTVLVSGPTANISQVLASYYGPRDVCGGAYPGLVDAVRDGGRVDVVYEQDLEKAVAAASTVDAVVLALGTDLNYAREGRDAPSIRLPADQLRLVQEVAAAARKPITVVLLTATPLDISQLMANVKIGAVAHLGQPSVAVVGFSDLLYGRRSFAGRAVQTVYPAAYEDEISIADFNMRPGPSVFARPDCAMKNASRCPRGVNPGRTYRFYEGKAVVPFGFGLSYTSFRYALRVVGANSFVVYVTNIGSMAADDVVLLFLVPPNAGADGVALKDLVAFDRVHVAVNATVSVALSVPPGSFATKGAHQSRPASAATREWVRRGDGVCSRRRRCCCILSAFQKKSVCFVSFLEPLLEDGFLTLKVPSGPHTARRRSAVVTKRARLTGANDGTEVGRLSVVQRRSFFASPLVTT